MTIPTMDLARGFFDSDFESLGPAPPDSVGIARDREMVELEVSNLVQRELAAVEVPNVNAHLFCFFESRCCLFVSYNSHLCVSSLFLQRLDAIGSRMLNPNNTMLLQRPYHVIKKADAEMP